VRRLILACLLALVFVFMAPPASTVCAWQNCTTIQDGTLYTTAGELITPGFDDWGYNYQAHLFNGYYCDAYQGASWCQPYADVALEMKWNDAWLSNQDCNNDGLLDRHFGFASYLGSGAWLTNHQRGTYLDARGRKQRWNYFTKIVAAPLDATNVGGVWLAADGSEIGAVIWGEFAVIQEVYNDTGTGDHGVLYLSPYAAGFGRFAPER
jgi:hypothetical protein